jgi:hypothetical protein
MVCSLSAHLPSDTLCIVSNAFEMQTDASLDQLHCLEFLCRVVIFRTSIGGLVCERFVAGALSVLFDML